MLFWFPVHACRNTCFFSANSKTISTLPWQQLAMGIVHTLHASVAARGVCCCCCLRAAMIENGKWMFSVLCEAVCFLSIHLFSFYVLTSLFRTHVFYPQRAICLCEGERNSVKEMIWTAASCWAVFNRFPLQCTAWRQSILKHSIITKLWISWLRCTRERALNAWNDTLIKEQVDSRAATSQSRQRENYGKCALCCKVMILRACLWMHRAACRACHAKHTQRQSYQNKSFCTAPTGAANCSDKFGSFQYNAGAWDSSVSSVISSVRGRLEPDMHNEQSS